MSTDNGTINAILNLTAGSKVVVTEENVTASKVESATLNAQKFTASSLRVMELEKALVAARAELEKETDAEKAAEKARIEAEIEKAEWEAAYNIILNNKKEMAKLREQQRKNTDHARGVFNKNLNFSITFLMNKWMESYSNAYYLPSGHLHYANLKDMAEDFCKSEHNTGNDNGDGWIFSTAYANIVYLKNHDINMAKCSQEFIDRIFEFLTDLT